MQTDWRKILIAYIRHVKDEEGWHFLPDKDMYGWLPVGLTDEEMNALLQARDEADSSPVSSRLSLGTVDTEAPPQN